MASVGVCFPREFPAADLLPCARAAERAGAGELWLVEDCFFTAAPTLAAAALTGTERIRIGLGILPAVLRNPAITAMELATLAGLSPGRLIAGIGHGVQEWMEQVGARAQSPLTALAEVLDAVRALLRGEQVSVRGQYVRLDAVRLEHPPQPVPPVLAGVFGPKSIALAGRHADGLVLAGWPVPGYVRSARELAAGSRPAGPGGQGFQVAVFVPTSVDRDRGLARARLTGELAAAIEQRPGTLAALPFFAELAALVRDRGPDALLTLPDDWWRQLGAIGTPDDVAAHLELLTGAGADRLAFFLPPDRSSWQPQLDLLTGLLTAPDE